MFIKRLLAIMIIGGWGLTLASEADLICQNLIQADPTTPGGYQILYADGTTQSFAAGDSIDITLSGIYRLCDDVNAIEGQSTTAGAIRISASSVDLDLAGFSVTGTGMSGEWLLGITTSTVNLQDITIKNGRVINFQQGIFLGRAINLLVQDVYVINCGALLDTVCQSGFCGGIVLAVCTDGFIDHCTAAGGLNLGSGFILTGDDLVVKDCLALTNSLQGFVITDYAGLNDSMNVVVERCVAVGNGGNGFENDKATGVLLGNLAYGNGTNYVSEGPGVVGSVQIANGAQLPPGAGINRSIDNIEII